MSNRKENISPLEELDVIEASELRVGHEFHAFRFRKAMEPLSALDRETRAILKTTTIGLVKAGVQMDDEALAKLVQGGATESNPLANFAQGMTAAVELIKKAGVIQKKATSRATTRTRK